jgi:hypothetical protein
MIVTSVASIIALSIATYTAPQWYASNTDGQCRQLEALYAQYAGQFTGVVLTPDQEKLKHKLVVWYRGHCRRRHVATAD